VGVLRSFGFGRALAQQPCRDYSAAGARWSRLATTAEPIEQVSRVLSFSSAISTTHGGSIIGMWSDRRARGRQHSVGDGKRPAMDRRVLWRGG
jgi:DNA-binding CsgD family transcriptional regulator